MYWEQSENISSGKYSVPSETTSVLYGTFSVPLVLRHRVSPCSHNWTDSRKCIGWKRYHTKLISYMHWGRNGKEKETSASGKRGSDETEKNGIYYTVRIYACSHLESWFITLSLCCNTNAAKYMSMTQKLVQKLCICDIFLAFFRSMDISYDAPSLRWI